MPHVSLILRDVGIPPFKTRSPPSSFGHSVWEASTGSPTRLGKGIRLCLEPGMLHVSPILRDVGIPPFNHDVPAVIPVTETADTQG